MTSPEVLQRITTLNRRPLSYQKIPNLQLMMRKIAMTTNPTLQLNKLSHPTEKKMTAPSLVTSPLHTGIMWETTCFLSRLTLKLVVLTVGSCRFQLRCSVLSMINRRKSRHLPPFNEYVNPGASAIWDPACSQIHGLTTESPEIQAADGIGLVWCRYCDWVNDHLLTTTPASYLPTKARLVILPGRGRSLKHPEVPYPFQIA